MDPNLCSVRMMMRVPSFSEEHRMFHFTLFSMNNDNEMSYLWAIAPNLAMDGIHILVEFIQIQQQTISTDGFGSPIDDFVESGTLWLLDWNDSMTDIQLGMRFVDKVQAIMCFGSGGSVWAVNTEL
ncbi:hypothetical protein M9H77_18157 [Catharanthus roseus]|uniref:Uncharacterized protein n=1 Tax=Catharanthus roseus TaxID=4058 RepID=A0ACC0B6Q1_CATRO|nr:hypothetical protein M9H77_18157 [Catharanthus roseus]